MNNGRIAVWLGLLAALVLPNLAQAQPANACKGGAGCAGSACPTSITSTQATLPTSACPFGGENQNAVDIFSWNEFIALSWPATTGCAADTTKSILDIKSGTQGPVVWQTYMTSDNVFVPTNQSPADWCTGDALSALFAQKPRMFGHISKAPPQKIEALAVPISQPNGVQAVGGVVTDQSGRWLRYEKMMNQPEYSAIVTNNWYRLSVINSITSLTLPPGSLELKAAWKLLTQAEIDGGKYYTTQAIVYNTPDHAQSPGANPVTLGLVGLHIIQKTPQQKNFFWSTFEHIDNDKVFFRAGVKTPINTQTAQKPFIELKQDGTPINQPVQIKRLTAIPANPKLNAYYKQLLAGSVFANYRLVSTQWTTGSGSAQAGIPLYVANIVVETYVQKASNKAKHPSTGCLACHINATAANNKTITDHSFLFLEAQ